MNMIEKVAITINDEVFIVKEQSIIEWKDTPEKLKNKIRKVAKAAIAAMREPTSNMVANAQWSVQPDQGNIERLIWESMIDAALKEGDK